MIKYYGDATLWHRLRLFLTSLIFRPSEFNTARQKELRDSFIEGERFGAKGYLTLAEKCDKLKYTVDCQTETIEELKRINSELAKKCKAVLSLNKDNKPFLRLHLKECNDQPESCDHPSVGMDFNVSKYMIDAAYPHHIDTKDILEEVSRRLAEKLVKEGFIQIKESRSGDGGITEYYINTI